MLDSDYYRRLIERERHRHEVRIKAGWIDSPSEQWLSTAHLLSTNHVIGTRKVHPASAMTDD